MNLPVKPPRPPQGRINGLRPTHRQAGEAAADRDINKTSEMGGMGGGGVEATSSNKNIHAVGKVHSVRCCIMHQHLCQQ